MFRDFNSQYSNVCSKDSYPTANVSQKKDSLPFYVTDEYFYQRYLDSLPPEEAFRYFPKGEEIIIHNVKKPSRSLRRIFYNIEEWTEYERKALTKYKQIIANSGFELPDYWSDGDNVRFIYSTNFDLELAFKQMKDHINWRKENFPMYFRPSDRFFEILNLGFAYIYGRDHQFRPLIVCQPYIYVKHEKKYTDQEWLDASVFICEYAANHLLIPGQIENWIMITNVRHVSMVFLPSKIKKIISVMSDNYRAKLYRNYVIGLSNALKFLFKIVCKFLDEMTVKKLVVIDNVNDGKILENIRKENIEEQFGGSAKNKEYEGDNLFPPKMPKIDFMLPNEKKEDILISKEDYHKRVMEGKIDTISPYYIEEMKQKKEEEEKENQRAIEREREMKRNEEREKNIQMSKDIEEMLHGHMWTPRNEFASELTGKENKLNTGRIETTLTYRPNSKRKIGLLSARTTMENLTEHKPIQSNGNIMNVSKPLSKKKSTKASVMAFNKLKSQLSFGDNDA